MPVYDLKIADVQIRLSAEENLTAEEQFQPFFAPCEQPDFLFRMHRTDCLPPVPDEVLYEGDCYRVHVFSGRRAVRSFFDLVRDPAPYAVCRYDYEAGTADFYYLPRGFYAARFFSNCIFYIGLETLMIGRKKVCMHAALIRSSAGGILFSGPSGIGKSTQADLWCRYDGAGLINGDRPIVGRKQGVWTGWGSPYAGSSRCYVNEEEPIAAVVFLNQAPEDSVRRLNFGEAYRRIYSQLTVSPWSGDFPARAFDTAVEMAQEIPAYILNCTKEETAVRCLKRQLGKDQNTYERN